MRRMLALVLVMVLLASAVPMAITPAAAYEKKIPCDDGDNELTKEELVNAILPYMLDEGDFTLDDMGDAAYVYAYWDGKSKTAVDDCDRTVTTYRPVERIVAGYRHSLETLRSLKVPKERIVGVEETWLDLAFFPEFADKPSVGIVWTPDVEAILNLDPDAVILIGSSSMAGAVGTATEVLESAGVTVIRISLTDIDTYQEKVEKLGYIFDKEEEAEELFEFIEKCSNSVSEKTETILEEDIPRVYFESAFYTGSYYIAGSTYLSHIKMAGGKDIFAGLSGYMSAEAIIEQDPEIILKFAPREYRDRTGYSVDAGDTEAMKAIRDEIISREELQNVTAVKNERVYVISGYLGCGGPVSGTRSFLLPAYLAKMFHPGHFDDLNPKALHQEYLTEFQGLDIDLDEKGVFVYHPEEFPDGN